MKKAFTLIELMVVVMIIAIIAAIAIPIAGFGCSRPGNNAQASFDNWLQTSYSGTKWNIKNAECVNYDTDNDRYVSCNAVLVDKDGDTKQINMECSVFAGNGCRAPKAVLTN
jgi:prepilin-type N-terminal cleavage/methylation domain-containing protein